MAKALCVNQDACSLDLPSMNWCCLRNVSHEIVRSFELPPGGCFLIVACSMFLRHTGDYVATTKTIQRYSFVKPQDSYPNMDRRGAKTEIERSTLLSMYLDGASGDLGISLPLPSMHMNSPKLSARNSRFLSSPKPRYSKFEHRGIGVNGSGAYQVLLTSATNGTHIMLDSL